MAPRSALVTGATGFIGGHLAKALVDGGWAVRACGRRSRPDDLPASAEYRAVDLAGDDDLGHLYDGMTHLFHLAGASSSKSDQEEMDRSNVAGTTRLLAAAPPGQLRRVVHMSSTSVYGEEVQLPLPVQEHVQPHPSRGYGKAKWGAEQAVQAAGQAGLPVVILRPVSVYGPGNVKLLASAILDVAVEAFIGAASVPVPAEPVEQRLVHIDDVVRASVHVADDDSAVGRVLNVVNEHYPTSHDIARILGGQLGMEIVVAPEPGTAPSYEERRAAHSRMVDLGMKARILLTEERFRFMRKTNRNNRLSVEALLSTGFRFRQTDLEASIGSTIDWYRNRRWIL